MRPTSRRAAAAALTVVLVALAGCSGGGSGDGSGGSGDGADGGSALPSGPAVRTDDSDDHADQAYVAMGDSYTAAPGVEPADDGSGRCGRSEINYPRLVAGAFGGSSITDVSCSGATTADLLAPQDLGGGESVPAQIEAVTADTDVVTISTGGNDFGAFAALAGQCAGGACGDLTLESAQQGLAAVTTDLAEVVEQVRSRAPQARVLVVGYPQVAPSGSEGCDDLPLEAGELGLVRLLNQQLSAAQERAAEQSGAEFVDLWEATDGHALCDDEPWINGRGFDGAVPYHPLAAEQRAAANAVIEVLEG